MTYTLRKSQRTAFYFIFLCNFGIAVSALSNEVVEPHENAAQAKQTTVRASDSTARDDAKRNLKTYLEESKNATDKDIANKIKELLPGQINEEESFTEDTEKTLLANLKELGLGEEKAQSLVEHLKKEKFDALTEKLKSTGTLEKEELEILKNTLKPFLSATNIEITSNSQLAKIALGLQAVEKINAENSNLANADEAKQKETKQSLIKANKDLFYALEQSGFSKPNENALAKLPESVQKSLKTYLEADTNKATQNNPTPEQQALYAKNQESRFFKENYYNLKDMTPQAIREGLGNSINDIEHIAKLASDKNEAIAKNAQAILKAALPTIPAKDQQQGSEQPKLSYNLLQVKDKKQPVVGSAEEIAKLITEVDNGKNKFFGPTYTASGPVGMQTQSTISRNQAIFENQSRRIEVNNAIITELESKEQLLSELKNSAPDDKARNIINESIKTANGQLKNMEERKNVVKYNDSFNIPLQANLILTQAPSVSPITGSATQLDSVIGEIIRKPDYRRVQGELIPPAPPITKSDAGDNDNENKNTVKPASDRLLATAQSQIKRDKEALPKVDTIASIERTPTIPDVPSSVVPIPAATSQEQVTPKLTPDESKLIVPKQSSKYPEPKPLVLEHHPVKEDQALSKQENSENRQTSETEKVEPKAPENSASESGVMEVNEPTAPRLTYWEAMDELLKKIKFDQERSKK